jgi:hypothetical protein
MGKLEMPRGFKTIIKTIIYLDLVSILIILKLLLKNNHNIKFLNNLESFSIRISIQVQEITIFLPKVFLDLR